MQNQLPILWYRNAKIRSRLMQLIAVAVTVWALYALTNNAVINMSERGVETSTWFLWTEASFKIGFTPFWEFTLGETKYWEIFIIGIQNTVLVSVLGIVGTTVLGFAIGVLRLSENWFARNFALAYIEIFRNIPLLLQIFFWYFVVILPTLPHRRNSIEFFQTVFINKEGIYLPTPNVDDGITALVLCVAVLIVGLIIAVMKRWAKNRFKATAKTFPVVLASIAIVICALISLFVVSSQFIEFETPTVGKLRVIGGFWIPISLFALWFSLVTYTAAFIAENVRAGVKAVSKGQIEAADSLGFHGGQTMKLILIPQALRVIIPPTISQYLNLTKNSSLAVAIGYDDLVNIWTGISLNQTGQALIIIAMTMAVFTCLSLFTSAVMNFYNARVQLSEGWSK